MAVNYHYFGGEVDCIFSSSDTILALEVKYRQDLNNALESLRDKQLKRIADGLCYFVEQFNLEYDNYRIDFCALAPNQFPYIIENVWEF